MWEFIEVVRIGQDFGQWYAQVTLSGNGGVESPFITFGAVEPTMQEVETQGRRLALQRNLTGAYVASDSITREAFFDRFTNTEIASIYQAANASADLFAYVKKLEMNPTVNTKNADVVNGLALLEQVGLLGAGRAAEILGA